MNKRMLKDLKKSGILYFIFLLLLSFVVYWKTFQLSLYGDDWLVISKFLQFGKTQGYLNPAIYISNYGFQNWIGIAYLFFSDRPGPYFVVSLFSRAILGYAVFSIIKKVYSNRAGMLAGLLFIVSSIGAQTTDWVYNANSYWGIALALTGLSLFLDSKSIKQKLISWSLILLGYIVAIIRVYVLPLLLPFVVFLGNTHSGKKLYVWRTIERLFKSTIAVVPFFAFKVFFSQLGFQEVNKKMLQGGISNALTMINEGRFDWIVSPFTNLGSTLTPLMFEKLQALDWRIYPLPQFLVYGLFLFFLAFILIYASDDSPPKQFLAISVLASLFFLVGLKLFVRYQGNWGLKEYMGFSWTFVGIVLTFVFVYKLVKEYKSTKLKRATCLMIGLVFTFSFLFPWLYNPGYLFGVTHRYLILTAVGLAMLLSIVYNPFFTENGLLRMLRIFLLTFFAFLQIINVNQFLGNQVEARPKRLHDVFFNQIQQQVPRLSEDRHSVFYFENVDLATYEQLIRFGFGFHMQLLYGLKYDEQIFPYSVKSIDELEKAVFDKEFNKKLGYSNTTTIDHVYAFRVNGEELINITNEIRAFLKNENK